MKIRLKTGLTNRISKDLYMILKYEKTGGTVVTKNQAGSLEQIRPAMQCHISAQKPQKTKLPNAIISPACSISFRLPVVPSPRQRRRRQTNRKRLKN